MPGATAFSDQELLLLEGALVHRPLRDQALLILGLNTGFRVNELLALDVGHVWDGEAVRTLVKLARAKLKGGRGCRRKAVTSRSVPLNDAARRILETYLFARFGSGCPDGALEEPLFPSRFRGGRLRPWRANRIVQELVRETGLEGQGSYSTHSWRKSFCLRLYRQTRDLNLVRACVGHAQISTTQRYVTVDADDVRNAILAIGASRGGAPVEVASTAAEEAKAHFLCRCDHQHVASAGRPPR